MNANELLRAGHLSEAIKALTEEVKKNPLDAQKRTFLFELLCFAAEFDRCEKQLDVLSQAGRQAELGALLYRAALHAERERQALFADKAYLELAAPEPSGIGMLNGQPFQDIRDADGRIGGRLEVFVAGRYLWVPFAQIASLEMPPPKRLRDLLWAPALVRNGPGFKGRDLGEVMIPVLSPFTGNHQDDAVRLGRSTVWEEVEGTEVPFGQKMLLVDEQEVPLLELRSLQFSRPEAEEQQTVATAG